MRDTKICIEKISTASLQLSNLSYTGFAAILPAETPVIEPCKSKADLIFPETTFSLNSEIIRSVNGIAGGKFVTDSTELRFFLQKKFKAEYLALNLISLSRQQLKDTPEGEPHWFYDGRENELYFIVNADKIIYLRIQTLGNVLEYFEGKTLQMRKIPRVETGSMRMPGTRLLGEIELITPEFKTDIERFIHHIDPMDNHRRQQILSILKNS